MSSSAMLCSNRVPSIVCLIKLIKTFSDLIFHVLYKHKFWEKSEKYRVFLKQSYLKFLTAAMIYIHFLKIFNFLVCILTTIIFLCPLLKLHKH